MKIRPFSTNLGSWKFLLLVILAVGLHETLAGPERILTFHLAYDKQVPSTTKMRLRAEDLYVSNAVILDETDIVSAKVERGIVRHILVVLTPAGAQRLHEVTASHLGERLGIVAGGKLISAPVILQATTENQFAISEGFLTEAETDSLAERINNAARKH
jgi:preprotein translocase subunit SecD